MTTNESTASEILHQMADSIIRDESNPVRDIPRQIRQCEQMIRLAMMEIETISTKTTTPIPAHQTQRGETLQQKRLVDTD